MQRRREGGREQQGARGFSRGREINILPNTTVHDSACTFKCFILSACLYLVHATVWTNAGRQTERAQFRQGLSKMYGLCGNWVSLILNGATVAESQHLSECHVVWWVCQPAPHMQLWLIHTHIHSPLLQHVIYWVSCPILFGLPAIYYWCNGALYLNAVLPMTSTSAQREKRCRPMSASAYRALVGTEPVNGWMTD